MKWIEESKLKEEWTRTISFEDYMDSVEKNPRSYVRPTNLYFKDLFNYYGTDDDGSFKLFQKDFPGSIPIRGQQKTQKRIYDNLMNFCEEGFNNKFLLLVGPNGSAKTSLVKKIMLSAEEYSKTDEGSLYTFSWVFPIESHIKGSLGLSKTATTKQLETFANLDDSDINAIINSELKDHPLLLISSDRRQKLIEDWFQDDPSAMAIIKKSYLYNGELSSKNKMIYDALLKSYKGDVFDVLRHVRVERFIISKSSSNSAVTVEPQLHVDARMQQITMDKRLASLPPSLQSLNLFQLNGEAVYANRGILEFSDLLKRPMDTFKYLLMTMETKNINLQGILMELDILFMGTSNEIHLQAFKQHPDFNSFRGRMNIIKVPYLLSAKDEINIYDEQVNNLKGRVTFEPYALEAICLFSVMTRVRPAQEKNYTDKRLGKIVSHLSPMEKILFISYDELPERLNSEEKQIIRANRDLILGEYDNEDLYEGRFGISPREIKQMIYEIGVTNKNISFVEVMDYLSRFIQRKNEFEFLNISPQGNYHNPHYFIKSIKDYLLDKYDAELRISLGLVDDRSYEEYIAKYIMHVSALLKGEKIKNNITGKFEQSDMFFVSEFESNINLKEDPDKFRSHTISKLGAYALDNPGREINYTDVFPGVVKRLKESFREEQKKKITEISRSLVFYISEINQKQSTPGDQLNKEAKEEIERVIKNLQSKFNYSKVGAINLFRYLIKERY